MKSTELINEYNHLETQIQIKLEEVEALRQLQKVFKDKLPRLYFVQGFDKSLGLAERIHFAGTFEGCNAWVGYNPKLSLGGQDGRSIWSQPTPSAPFQFAGEIREVTPVDSRWFEIYSIADSDYDETKGGDDAL